MEDADPFCLRVRAPGRCVYIQSGDSSDWDGARGVRRRRRRRADCCCPPLLASSAALLALSHAGYLIAAAGELLARRTPGLELAIVLPERRACADRSEADAGAHDPPFSERVLATAAALLAQLCPSALVVRCASASPRLRRRRR